MKRLGRAEIGVSRSRELEPALLEELLLFELDALVDVDRAPAGRGRAKGLGGPVAPALSGYAELADGDGGGRTGPAVPGSRMGVNSDLDMLRAAGLAGTRIGGLLGSDGLDVGPAPVLD